jgi:hypothetical protein
MVPHYLYFMKQSDMFRENAENCLHLAGQAEGQPAYNRYLRMAEAWTALAHEQDWLDGVIPPARATVLSTRSETFEASPGSLPTGGRHEQIPRESTGLD